MVGVLLVSLENRSKGVPPEKVPVSQPDLAFGCRIRLAQFHKLTLRVFVKGTPSISWGFSVLRPEQRQGLSVASGLPSGQGCQTPQAAAPTTTGRATKFRVSMT